MREVLFINVGQAGVQIANAVWELFCVEHSIGHDGLPYNENVINGIDSFKTVFLEIPNGQYVPRVLSIDLEPTVIDEVRTGCYRNLFHPDQLISGFEDASNNYARGHFTVGRKIISKCVNQVRKLVQTCDCLQGFIVSDSLAGGTGSGFSTLLGERLCIEYTKRPKFQFGVYPAPKLESCVVSPYNTVMNTFSSMDFIDLAVIMDNESIYDIASGPLMIQRPTFTNLNRLIAQVISSITVSLRFENTLNSDLDQLTTNLVPYPRIHFPMSQYAPIECQSRVEHETIDEFELTRTIFAPNNQFLKVDAPLGRLMSCSMQYRGDVNPKRVNQALFEVKRKNHISFVDWCPTGFKVGINSFPPAVVPSSAIGKTSRSVTMLSNTTAVKQMWQKLNVKFDKLFAKRSFVFWFVGEGMEEGEFTEARDCLATVVKDYDEVGKTLEEMRGDKSSVIKSRKSSNEVSQEGQAPVPKRISSKKKSSKEDQPKSIESQPGYMKEGLASPKMSKTEDNSALNRKPSGTGSLDKTRTVTQ